MKVIINPLTLYSKKNTSNSLSNNNYLSSLKVSGYTISPKFEKNTTDYILKLDNKVEKINIIATPEDSKATVSGVGKQFLEDGENNIEVIVTSEKGEDRIYSIKITTTEKDPITVNIDNKKYTVQRLVGDIKIPKDYQIKKITLNNEEIEALYSETTKLTLVVLKDEDGNINLYIYEEDGPKYTLYNQITTEEISFLPIETDKVPNKNYQLYKEIINKTEVDCYKISKDSNYCIIYGLNLNTKEENWYVYDFEEETLQKYSNEIDKYYNEKIKSTRILIYILSATTLIFGIGTISFAIKSSKKR